MKNRLRMKSVFLSLIQVVVYTYSQFSTYQGGEFLQGGIGNAGNRTVMEDEALFGLFAHALDFAQGTLDGRL